MLQTKNTVRIKRSCRCSNPCFMVLTAQAGASVPRQALQRGDTKTWAGQGRKGTQASEEIKFIRVSAAVGWHPRSPVLTIHWCQLLPHTGSHDRKGTGCLTERTTHRPLWYPLRNGPVVRNENPAEKCQQPTWVLG
ncbi:hypothetical protein HJG60_009825 [Phyllostomus discolor]|uniref:Uncharacterized protein n=1 Tax=Phyllostomus discolor TaxID=89673 RepID=A0A834ET16_9CHIR|nr:hypothetical protein HJG60_009825 [Phyllostomus discolor]